MTVGERIKALRLKVGMSQVEFAEKIDVSKQTLYKYENNIITNIPSDKIEAAAKVGGTSPAALMGWEPIRDVILYDSELPDGIHVQISGKEHQKDLMKRITAYMELLDANRKKADDYIDTLLSVQNMEDELALAAAHKRTDIETTAEMHQHDDDIMNDDSEWE